MPRFSARPHIPPPPIPTAPALEVRGAVARDLSLGPDRLAALERVEMVADFHCVTTWSIFDLRWSGWRLRDLWEQIIVPEAAPGAAVTHLRARSLDGYFAVLDLEDALREDVLIADRLGGAPLDAVHGAPLRLVSPAHYAYKSVKHLASLSLYTSPPRRFAGGLEHPRARVHLEERHARIGGRLLRWPYRALILPVAWLARRSARRA